MNKNFKLIRSIFFCGAMAALAAAGSLPAAASVNLTTPLTGMHAQVKPAIYPYHMDPKSQIHDALLTAAMQHRRVVVNFGSNSCEACRLLATYLHESRNFILIKRNYAMVYVNVGPNFDQHGDVARDYGVALTKGVPALVVLDKSGKKVSGDEFRDLRKQGSAPVTAFLEKWKPSPNRGMPGHPGH